MTEATTSSYLCALCGGLNFQPWECLSPMDQEIIGDRRHVNEALHTSRYEWYIHYRSIEDLAASAQAGCYSCALLWHGIVEPPPFFKSHRRRLNDQPSSFGETIVFEMEVAMKKDRSSSWASFAETWFRGFYVYHDGYRALDLRMADPPPVGFQRLSDELAKTWTQTRAFEADNSTGSQFGLRCVETWYSECLSNHTHCRQEPKAMPTREIDLGTDNDFRDIRLYQTTSHDLEGYVALSHCWGGVRFEALQRSTANNAYSQVVLPPFQQWPKTFRDAFTVTKALGIRYIWIDCVCIIQNNEEDWVFESSRMAAYYGNAELVIAASRAWNSNQGFFSQRNPLLVRPSHLTLRPDNPVASIIPNLWIEMNENYDQPRETEPLHS